MYPTIKNTFKFADDHPLLGEILFRSFIVVITFVVAELVPNLGLLLSLIGAVCSTVLVLVLPPLMELIILSFETRKFHWILVSKNLLILLLSVLCFLLGGYESLSGIIKAFFT